MRIVLALGLVVLLIFLLLYPPFRRYLKLVRQFVQTVRHFRQVNFDSARPADQVEKLIQCGNCGTWVPASRALAANLNDYCSKECLQAGVAAARRGKKAS